MENFKPSNENNKKPYIDQLKKQIIDLNALSEIKIKQQVKAEVGRRLRIITESVFELGQLEQSYKFIVSGLEHKVQQMEQQKAYVEDLQSRIQAQTIPVVKHELELHLQYLQNALIKTEQYTSSLQAQLENCRARREVLIEQIRRYYPEFGGG